MRSASPIRLVLVSVAALAIASSAFAGPKMCIDPGHGGSDAGATGGGLYEKTINLDAANKLKVWFDKDTADTGGGYDWVVIRTRSTDVYVSLSGRTTYANNNSAARFMSIHANAFNSAANGIETFCHTSLGTSADLRNKVYEEAVAMWPLVRRGTKTATFYVLAYTNMPAELHEMAFIDSSVDRVYLGNATHRDNHAKSELWAAQRHYGKAKYTPTTGVTVTVDNTSGNFACSANWSTGTSAGYYGTNYRWRGTAAVSDAATWNYSLSSSGSYKVSAWWVAGTNRAPSAPYIITRSGGTSTVNVNQQANGGKWNLLGTYTIASGSNNVKLSCWTTTGYVVIADAVRISNQ